MADLKRKSPPENEEPNNGSTYQTAHDVFYSDRELLGKIFALLKIQGDRDDDDKDDDPPELTEAIAQLFKAVAHAIVARDDLPVWPKDMETHLDVACNTRSPRIRREKRAFNALVDYILRANEKHPKPKKNTAPAPEPFTEATKAAWQIPYIGRTPQLLKRTIEDICKKQEEFKEFKPYANFLAIIQGSGTGKSRVVDELAQTVFTIPVCIRPDSDESGYPLGDKGAELVHKFFAVKENDTASVYHCRYLMFLLKAIQFAERWIDEQKKNNRPLNTLASEWREYLGAPQTQNRMALFTAACDETPLEGFDGIFKVENMQNFSKTDKIKTSVCDYVNTVTAKLARPDAPPPMILFYFDEAHHLTNTVLKTVPIRTAYQCLCKALTFLSKATSVFTLFLSTYSRLSEFAPSARHFWSSRPLDRETDVHMHPPFVELPFDVCKPAENDYIMKEGTHSFEDICSLTFMARFGRPLFWALLQNDANTYSVLETAMEKLKLRQEIVTTNGPELPQLLPLIAARVDLTFESNRDEAVYLEGLLVASSLRTVYSVPEHRQYLRGGYSSEPFVAEAAARLMYRQLVTDPKLSTNEQAAESYKTTVASNLLTWLNRGLISKGVRGELVARLLLTIAHDVAIMNLKVGRQLNECPSFSEMVPVVDFLAALISKDYQKDIFSMQPSNTTGPTLEEAFENGYVHFTQFIKAGDIFLVTDEGAYLGFGRGAAIQGHDNLASVDLIIPVWIRYRNSKYPDRWSMTCILIQVKNRIRNQSISMTADNKDFQFFSQHDDRPYITIAMELGVLNTKKPSTADNTTPPTAKVTKKPRKAVTKKSNKTNARGRAPAPVPMPSTPPGNNTSFPMSSPAEVKVKSYARKQATRSAAKERPRYDIKIRGCSHKVYNVVPQDNTSYKGLLAHKDILSEHPRPQPEYREAIMQMKPFWVKNESYDWVAMEKSTRVGARVFTDAGEPAIKVQEEGEVDPEDEDVVICQKKDEDDEEGKVGEDEDDEDDEDDEEKMAVDEEVESEDEE